MKNIKKILIKMEIYFNDLIPTYKELKVNDKFAASIEVKGAREKMEDTSIMFELDIEGYYMFCIFDGHGGKNTSYYLRDNFKDFFIEHTLWKDYVNSWECNLISKLSIISDSTEIDDFSNIENNWRIIFSQIFFDFDRKIYNSGIIDGSTAIIVLLTPDYYISVNCGDSEASVINENFDFKLSKNHKPNDKEEYLRIIENNHYVNNGRIDGRINLSRSFGDFFLKQMDNKDINPINYALTVLPTVKMYERCKEDKYIILGCDGFWELFENNSLKLKNLLIEDIGIQIFTRHIDLSKEFEQTWLSEQNELEFKKIDGVQNYIIPKDENSKDIYKLPNYKPSKLKPYEDIDLLKWQLKKLVDYAVKSGSLDNITIILVKI
jgi:serine/threonine protein phosphatase PrpC